MSPGAKLSALLVEEAEGSWSAFCPELGLSEAGETAEAAMGALVEASRSRIREARAKGEPGFVLKAVKCLRFDAEP